MHKIDLSLSEVLTKFPQVQLPPVLQTIRKASGKGHEQNRKVKVP